jgi:hypothetical protein
LGLKVNISAIRRAFAVVIDLVMVALFLAYLVSVRRGQATG